MEEELINQSLPTEIGTYGMQVPQMPSQADLVEKITPRMLAEEIEHKLRGEVWDRKELKWYQPEESKPYLNEEGIWRMMAIITSFINDNTIYSNLNDEQIRLLMLALSAQVIGLLRQKYILFEVDKADLTSIKNIILDSTFLALLRAKGGRERGLLSKSISESIISRQQLPEQKRSLIPGMPNLFKK